MPKYSPTELNEIKILMKKYLKPFPSESILDNDDFVEQCMAGEVSLKICAEEYYKAVHNEINKTKSGKDHFIHITGWGFSEDFRLPDQEPANMMLKDILKERAQSGIEVKFMAMYSNDMYMNDLDRRKYFFGFCKYPFSDVWAGNQKLVTALRSANSSNLNAILNDDVSKFGSHHVKAVIIRHDDGIVAFVGGIDMLTSRQDSTEHPKVTVDGNALKPNTNIHQGWHDAAVMLRGLAAYQVWEDFYLRWNSCVRYANEMHQSGYPDKIIYGCVLVPRATSHISDAFYNKVKNDCTNIQQSSNGSYNPITHFYTHTSNAPMATVISKSYGPIVMGAISATKKWNGAWINNDWPEYSSVNCNEYKDCVKKAISSAKNYVYMEDQFFDQPRSGSFKVSMAQLYPKIVYSLLLAAAGRNVKVILLSSCPVDEPKFVPTHLSKTVLNDHLLNPIKFPKLQTITSGNIAFFISEYIGHHSKIIIVDDEFFGIGSANAVDRSLRGIDSEVTCCVVAKSGAGGNSGRENPHPVKDLRRHLWLEAMGLQLYNKPKETWTKEESAMWDRLYDPIDAFGMWRTAWKGEPYPCEKPGYPCGGRPDPNDPSKAMPLPGFFLTDMMKLPIK